MKSSEIKVGVSIYKDRDEMVYGDEKYFSYIEYVNFTKINGDDMYFNRQHIYIDGKKHDQGDERGDNFGAGVSSLSQIKITKDDWDTSGWGEADYFTEEQIKQKIVHYVFNKHI